MKTLFPFAACLLLSLGFAWGGSDMKSSDNSVRTYARAALLGQKKTSGIGSKDARDSEPGLAVKPKDAVRLMSYNVRGVRGMDDKMDYARTAQVIKEVDPDVVALQEIDKGTSRSKKADQAQKLGELTGMEYAFAGAIPYQGGEYGIAVLSKQKPLSQEKIVLPGTKEARAMLVVEFPDFVFCCSHFDLVKKDRLESAKIANKLAGKYKKPVFLAGDLNDHPNSQIIKELKKEWVLLTPDNKFTFPADKPNETIDYIFMGKDGKSSCKMLNTGVINEPAASDHRPIYVDVLLRK